MVGEGELCVRVSTCVCVGRHILFAFERHQWRNGEGENIVGLENI